MCVCVCGCVCVSGCVEKVYNFKITIEFNQVDLAWIEKIQKRVIVSNTTKSKVEESSGQRPKA